MWGGGGDDTTRDGETWKVAEEEEEVGEQRVYWLSA